MVIYTGGKFFLLLHGLHTTAVLYVKLEHEHEYELELIVFLSSFCYSLYCYVILYFFFLYVYILFRGENNFSQLGTGDTRDRYKPTQITRLRVARVKSVSAGQYHCVAVAKAGTVFSWGKNQYGQCAQGRTEDRMNTIPVVSIPTVVNRLQEICLSMHVVSIACGFSHTLMLLTNKVVEKESSSNNVCLGFGLNTSGQLGLSHNENSARPKKIVFSKSLLVDVDVEANQTTHMNSTTLTPKDIYCGGHHSFIVCDVVKKIEDDEEKYVPQPTRSRRSIPALTFNKVRRLLSISVASGSETTAVHGRSSSSFQRLELSVFSAFSSASVLNASFLNGGNGVQHATESDSGLDMLSVRQSYEALFSFGGGVLSTRLGQATYRLVEVLRHCPFDEMENLRVFLIVFENPLLMDSASNHVVVSRFMNALLRLPAEQRGVVFVWIASLPSEYFATVVRVVQRFLTFMTRERKSNVSSGDTTPACLILAHFYTINRDRMILPWTSFYNDAISAMPLELLKRDYRTWLDPYAGTSVHSICKTCPFLLDPEAKRKLVRVDATDRMSQEVSFIFTSTYLHIPPHTSTHLHIPPHARHERLLSLVYSVMRQIPLVGKIK